MAQLAGVNVTGFDVKEGVTRQDPELSEAQVDQNGDLRALQANAVVDRYMPHVVVQDRTQLLSLLDAERQEHFKIGQSMTALRSQGMDHTFLSCVVRENLHSNVQFSFEACLRFMMN